MSPSNDQDLIKAVVAQALLRMGHHENSTGDEHADEDDDQDDRIQAQRAADTKAAATATVTAREVLSWAPPLRTCLLLLLLPRPRSANSMSSYAGGGNCC